jgi:hypothetical protein
MISQFTYVQSLVERNVVADIPLIIPIQIATATDVVEDSTFADASISNIRIQNQAGNAIYVTYGQACTATQYHYILDAHQVLEVDVRQRVNVWSPTYAGIVSVMILRRIAQIPGTILQ